MWDWEMSQAKFYRNPQTGAVFIKFNDGTILDGSMDIF